MGGKAQKKKSPRKDSFKSRYCRRRGGHVFDNEMYSSQNQKEEIHGRLAARNTFARFDCFLFLFFCLIVLIFLTFGFDIYFVGADFSFLPVSDAHKVCAVHKQHQKG